MLWAGFAAIAYLAMLSGQGWLATTGCRQFFYARYMDYAVTTSITVLVRKNIPSPFPSAEHV